MSDVSPRDHLANERTFLAWVRTSIALMGFGVVIAKLRFLTLDSGPVLNSSLPPGTRSTWLGLAFAGVGLLTLLFAAVQYERTRRALETGTYRSSGRALFAFVGVIFLLSAATLAYLFSLTPR